MGAGLVRVPVLKVWRGTAYARACERVRRA